MSGGSPAFVYGYAITTYSGRGPKGYKRSDQRIQEDLSEELTRNHELDASDIEVRVQDGDVTLTGTVDSRQAKRLAEDIAESCSGVNEVHNQLRINRSASQRSGESSKQGSSGSEQMSGSMQGSLGTEAGSSERGESGRARSRSTTGGS
jgi:hypothetical protein